MIDLTGAIDATWPALRQVEVPGFTLREGAGGGSRVSAATARDGWRDADIAGAEAGMRDLGQRPLFMVREGEAELDARLEARGYVIADPTVLRAAPVDVLDDREIPRVTVFTIWEPLAIMAEIWAAGGVGPARLAVMERVTGPKTAIFGRIKDQPAGTAFAAIHQGTVFVHAVEVLPRLRRNGMAVWMMRLAARWGRAQGAERVAILVTRANDGANALYASLGMGEMGGYHYRKHPEEAP
ncbi:Acetyltransferase (GNAT) family protein [Roseivivax lentus]|uniref:Acetyltransferase (GNAT) family protein n=1 Tax=Roseivivax lentus TaxID=633194 RepID=A0A1N7K9I6_9RHOB|nr:GNAT family N-acetyltransferase [Roseivivax lentus]SIS58124.1 Acetyltransferase (GNAT) family protein [Roseivivax lentus]